ncbi:glycogen/starch/alpha-glucan phosphorylase [Chthoniobacter flavus Ellin428]|uniref:Alpha-1,4 glucan phosphorylase n=1 Tax=Chthoniobacter flavus Ellin428 TaxID=497964 RepID=B4D1V2_9BACT|nr:glycogen/starch/alpha-glucan phosphorylase [Chthoniobacter flavus]EDY19714.1 glycogen/starch/alpha-glucan phosphorylase [Chthoniobacter flavus Ellin428]TCO92945.1 starch phosphorylase [Chthoniobacter flavus]
MSESAQFTSAIDHSVPGLKKLIKNHLKFSLARDTQTASRRDWWLATSKAAQSLIIERMIATQTAHHRTNAKRVYYFSLEFLMGRLFSNSLYSAGIFDEIELALQEMGLDTETLRKEEYDMALGNGGLGRLAACFLDSLATLDLPAVGYGIHYQYGLFKQEFRNGHQVELPDAWLTYGTPWEIVRPEHSTEVQVFGQVENVFDDRGNYVPRWTGGKKILGVPYDIPIPGFGTNTVNFLRLWESRAPEEFDFEAFNRGGYGEAVREKNVSETISKVLYPNDKTESGKELRLVQQYFFVACSLRDIFRRFRKDNEAWEDFPEKVAIQLNDTHPAIAIVELLRLFHDEYGMAWEKAWSIVTKTFAYTNHTLLPEALEKWSVPLFQKVLPRHLQLIFEINKRHLEQVEAKWPGDVHRKRVLSIIEEGHVQMVRMAHLSVVGSFSVNGVAALHTQLLKAELFPEFDEMFPGKFNNKTNGITPRRWLLACNPRLSTLISKKIGTGWERDLDKLRGLEQYANDPDFQSEFMAVKHANKVDLARIIKTQIGISVNPAALFDVQIKRLHEYKRQHLNLLHILALYRRLLQNPDLDIAPRVFIFSAKAAPGYDLAKCIIKAINSVGTHINADKRINDRLKVVFLPNYRVSLAQRIVPAADLSEQISTAGKEASGTGNMKLALNGALTIGTLDGANVEIREEVGEENIFICGMTVEEVTALVKKGYRPHDFYMANEELRAVVDWIGSNYFTPDEPGCLRMLCDNLIYNDPFLVLADFQSYSDSHKLVDAAFKDKPRWAKMAIMNTARMGKFSSDRTIGQYASEIWKLDPVKV